MYKQNLGKIFVTAIFLFSLFISHSFAVDVDHDNIDDDYEDILAHRYSPHYIFHPDERFYFMDPAAFLNKSGGELNDMIEECTGYSNRVFPDDNYWSVDCDGDINIYPQDLGFPNHTYFTEMLGLLNPDSLERISVLNPELYNCIIENDWKLKIPTMDFCSYFNGVPGGKPFMGFCHNDSNPVYYIVEKNEEDNIELQFWHFSPMDRKNAPFGLGDHMFEWTRIVIVFSSYNQEGLYYAVEPPLYTFYSCHGCPHLGRIDSPFHPRYIVWADIQDGHIRNGTHPVVYIANDDHENYYENDDPLHQCGGSINYADGDCHCNPFYVNSKVYSYYDKVCGGIEWEPNNLINLQNGLYPNSSTPWFIFTGKWGNGTTSPLGGFTGIRSRQYNIYKRVYGDDGNLADTYRAFNSNKLLGMYALFCQWPQTPDFVQAVLEPLGFINTAFAFFENNFVDAKATFSVSIKNSNQHTPLTATNYINIYYQELGGFEYKSARVWSGHDTVISYTPGTTFYLDSLSSASTGDHYWEVQGPITMQFPDWPSNAIRPRPKYEISIVEKVKITFDVRTIPTSQLPGDLTIDYHPNVALLTYKYFEESSLPSNGITTLDLPVGADYRWSPSKFEDPGGSERWATRDYNLYVRDTVHLQDTVFIDFYHQFKTEVDLKGAYDYALSVNIDTLIQFGDTLQKYNIYDKWINWCDNGSSLMFDPCLYFYPSICTDDPVNFNITQSLDTSIDYTYLGDLGFETFQVTDDTYDQNNLHISYNKLLFETNEPSEGINVYLYNHEDSSLMNISNCTICSDTNTLSDIDGSKAAWISPSSIDSVDIIVYNLVDSTYILPFTRINNIEKLDISNNRIGCASFDEEQTGSAVYDLDSNAYIYLISYMLPSNPDALMSSISLSGNNMVSAGGIRVNANESYSIDGRFTGMFFDQRVNIKAAFNRSHVDTKIFMVPEISGYDVAFVTNYLWWSSYTTLEYVDMSEDILNPNGWKGKHYTLGLNWDTLYQTNIWDIPQVSGGFLSVGLLNSMGEVYGLYYISLDSVKESCADYYLTTDQNTDCCFNHCSHYWHSLAGKEYEMSGNNFFIVNEAGSPGSETDYVYFHQASSGRTIIISDNSNPKKSPRVSGFNCAWLENDGNDWEVFLSVGAPRPDTFFTDQIVNNGAGCHIDSLLGDGFQEGMRVFLANSKGQNEGFSSLKNNKEGGKLDRAGNLIEATNIQTDIHLYEMDKLSCDFELVGVDTGNWSLVILNPDGQVGATGDIVNIEPEELPGMAYSIYPPDGATNISTEISMYWQDATLADSYYVYIGVHPDSVVIVYTGQSPVYTPPNLINNNTYYWRVDSKNYGGTTQGDIYEFTTICEIPEPVTDPKPLPGDAEIPLDFEFSWRPQSPADSFQITIINRSGTDSIIWNTEDTFIVATGLSGMMNYTWKIKAINIAGFSESSEWWFKTAPTALPGIPTNGYPNDDSNIIDGITLRWDSCYQTENYIINFGSENPPPEEGITYDPEYQPFFLYPDTVYYWQVVSQNSLGTTEGPIWQFHTAKIPNYLAGKTVYYDMVKPLPYVTINLSGNSILVDTTGTNGTYSFENLEKGTYTLTPDYYEDDPGVSVADCIKIRRHLADLEPFDPPYKLIAGDVNCTGNVSVADVIKIRRYLAKLDSLPCGNWKFIDSSWYITDTNWDSALSFIDVDFIGLSFSDSNFIGIRLGDVNNTWGDTLKMVAKTKAGLTQIGLNDSYGIPGDTISFPVFFESDRTVAGLEFHLSYNTEEIKYVDASINLPSEPTFSQINGEIHFIWEDIERTISENESGKVAEFRFEILNEFKDSSEVEIRNAEIVDTLGQSLFLTLKNGFVSREGMSNESALLPTEFMLEQNKPNPFNPVTEIRFSIPIESNVDLEIFNILGQRVIALASGRFKPGYYSYLWDGSNSASGIYFTRLRAGEFVDTKKMMLLK